VPFGRPHTPEHPLRVLKVSQRESPQLSGTTPQPPEEHCAVKTGRCKMAQPLVDPRHFLPPGTLTLLWLSPTLTKADLWN
jgi:hypothetical protein